MFELPDLPYEYDALEPAVSSDTLQFHHDKHHKTYVEKTNELAAKAGLAGKPLEEVVREAKAKGDQQLFNNAAQAWNHGFFWRCMSPDGDGAPKGKLLEAINQAFGDVAAFKKAFVEEGFNHFGSGWVWLVTGAEGLKVISTHDADDTLPKDGVFPLIVCDLWEHAYYLDYQNDRKAFLEKWFDGAANWSFAEKQLAAAEGKGQGWRYPPPETDSRAGAGAGQRPNA